MIPILGTFSVVKAKEFYFGILGVTVDWERDFEENIPAWGRA